MSSQWCGIHPSRNSTGASSRSREPTVANRSRQGSRISSFIKNLAQHRIRGEPASGKLEILRRFCERAWYSDRIPVRDLWAFAEAGYSWTDAQQILALVAAQRGFSPTIEGYRG